MGDKSVAFDGCRLKKGQELFESLSGLLYLINEGSSVHYRGRSIIQRLSSHGVHSATLEPQAAQRL